MYEFLQDNLPFFLATVRDRDRIPMVIPMGFVMGHRGLTYFAVPPKYDCYRQLLNNPTVVIVARGDYRTFLKLSGRVVFDDSEDLLEKAREHFEKTAERYNALRDMFPRGPKPPFFYLKDARGAMYFHDGDGKAISLPSEPGPERGWEEPDLEPLPVDPEDDEWDKWDI